MFLTIPKFKYADLETLELQGEKDMVAALATHIDSLGEFQKQTITHDLDRYYSLLKETEVSPFVKMVAREMETKFIRERMELRPYLHKILAFHIMFLHFLPNTLELCQRVTSLASKSPDSLLISNMIELCKHKNELFFQYYIYSMLSLAPDKTREYHNLLSHLNLIATGLEEEDIQWLLKTIQTFERKLHRAMPEIGQPSFIYQTLQQRWEVDIINSEPYP